MVQAAVAYSTGTEGLEPSLIAPELHEQRSISVITSDETKHPHRALDDVADMFVRLIQKLHSDAKDPYRSLGALPGGFHRV